MKEINKLEREEENGSSTHDTPLAWFYYPRFSQRITVIRGGVITFWNSVQKHYLHRPSLLYIRLAISAFSNPNFIQLAFSNIGWLKKDFYSKSYVRYKVIKNRLCGRTGLNISKEKVGRKGIFVSCYSVLVRDYSIFSSLASFSRMQDFFCSKASYSVLA